jgi:hypothetical protein
VCRQSRDPDLGVGLGEHLAEDGRELHLVFVAVNLAPSAFTGPVGALGDATVTA